MEYIRKAYGVPAKRGGRIKYLDAKPPVGGTILSATTSGRLRIRLDGIKRVGHFHPTWMLSYVNA